MKDSFQEQNLNFLQDELERQWPKEAERIYDAL